jgi:RHS repeat-associated protein
VTVTEGNTRYFYVLNQQGDVVAIINGNGDFVVEYYYDAWGRLLSTTGTLATTLGKNNPLRYRGYVYDTETGLYYLQSRYYNPTWGRFINADDPGYMGIDGTPSSYNLFSYCGNNPVTRADDDGEFWHIVIGAVVGLVTQYVSDVVAQCKEGKSFWEALKPKSSWVDYGAAALSGAVGATGIGFLGSIAANAGISGGQYLANCVIEGKTPDIDQLGFEVGFGAFSGMIGGKGADGANLLGKYKTSKHVLKTTISRKKGKMYAAKIKEIKKTALKSIRQSIERGVPSNLFKDDCKDQSGLW